MRTSLRFSTVRGGFPGFFALVIGLGGSVREGRSLEPVLNVFWRREQKLDLVTWKMRSDLTSADGVLWSEANDASLTASLFLSLGVWS